MIYIRVIVMFAFVFFLIFAIKADSYTNTIYLGLLSGFFLWLTVRYEAENNKQSDG